MEVLHGNQAGSKHSRRRSDRFALAENRMLDWGEHDADIVLQPHSPLALADALTTKGGYLDLVPRQANTDDTPEQASAIEQSPNRQIVSTDHRSAPESRRGVRERFNLLTQHSESELLRQCKKILVDNALIKSKGDRQLYLAAGFISWSNPNNTTVRNRAPLLLFPALLVRITDEQRYEIRLTGDTPEFNTTLAQHLEQRHSLSLPALENEQLLVDYFAQVAQSIHDASPLRLEFEVALGSASLFSGNEAYSNICLPEIPANFDVALAMSITGNKSLEHLTAVLKLIPDFSRGADVDLQAEPTVSTPALSGAALLRRYAAKLAAEGLDHIEFRQLPALPEHIIRWKELMLQASATHTLALLAMEDLSARELIKLTGIIELIDKAPYAIDQWGHGDLCYANSTLLLRRAQHQAKLIEDEMLALQEHFYLDKVPGKSQLLSLMNELGGSLEHEPDIVDADYFNARRQFMEFSTKKPANMTSEHRRLLSQLAKVLRFRELFVNNIEYRAALGTSYKGLRTDWPTLVQTSDYSRELADVLGSEALAATIINHWQEFRGSFAKELETLQQAGDATRRLLTTVGKRWQTQTISALATHASLIADRLEEWNNQYGSVENHADKTADMVLSSFSAPFMDHVLVETQVDETQSRIRQQLADGEINLAQIQDTLSWLSQASATATVHELEIDSIVEQLQMA